MREVDLRAPADVRGDAGLSPHLVFGGLVARIVLGEVAARDRIRLQLSGDSADDAVVFARMPRISSGAPAQPVAKPPGSTVRQCKNPTLNPGADTRGFSAGSTVAETL